MIQPRFARDIGRGFRRSWKAPLFVFLTLAALGGAADAQPTLGTPSVSGDQLIFLYDARTDRTTFLSVANVSDETVSLDVAFYAGDLTSEVAGATVTLGAAANTVIDPTSFGGGGAAGNAGLAVVTPVVSADNLTPVVPPQPIVGGFTFANLSLESGFGQNPFGRRAVSSGSGAQAAPGTQVDGAGVVYERFDPGILNIPVYFDPATLASPANDGNRVLLAAFADDYDGAFSISPVSTQAAVTFFDNAGVRIAENSISINGVLFSDLQAVSGGAAIDGSSGKVFFEVNAQGGNVFGLFSQSISTFAAGQRMPAVNEVPVGVDPPEPTPQPPSNVPFSRNALLGQYADELILPLLRDFASQAQALAGAVAAYAAGPSDSTRGAAQAAWSTAMQTFQRLEPMQFGPGGSASMFMGGQGIRDEIYSWPIVNDCAVDQTTVDDDFRNANFFQSELVNVYGLDALELLLFRTGDGNQCSPRVDINRDGTWGALVSSGGLQQRQADYAAVVANGIADQANRLRDAWEPSGGNFAAEVRNAGNGGSVYGSAKEALDEVFAAFFFVDIELKDAKLALPAGISPECPDATCPEDVELPFSRRSKEAIVANLDGAAGIFSGEGTAGQGFAWYLRDMGSTALADRMTSQLAAARNAANAIPGSLTDALSGNHGAVTNAHTQLQTFTTDVKSEFVSVLNLTIPQEGAGDND